MRNALVHRQAPRVGLDAAKVDHVIEKKKKKHKSVLQSRRTNGLLIKTRLHSAASVSSARGAKKGKKKKRGLSFTSGAISVHHKAANILSLRKQARKGNTTVDTWAV